MLEGSALSPSDYNEIALSLKLYISYTDTDDIGDAASLLLDLDNTKHGIVVLFEYVLTYEKYLKLVADYAAYKTTGINRNFAYYIGNHINQYFTVRIKALEIGNEINSKIVTNDIVRSVIAYAGQTEPPHPDFESHSVR